MPLYKLIYQNKLILKLNTKMEQSEIILCMLLIDHPFERNDLIILPVIYVQITDKHRNNLKNNIGMIVDLTSVSFEMYTELSVETESISFLI